MKRIIFWIFTLIVINGFAHAQERGEVRGTVPGELYMAEYWYGIYNPNWGYPVFDTLIKALYHITDYGKKLTFPYCADAFAHQDDYPYFDSTVVVPVIIMSDATSGVIYNRSSRYSSTANTWLHSLWVSFDHGKTWTLKEEDIYRKYYYTSYFEGLIYKAQNIGYDNIILESQNYGNNWQKIGEQGFIYNSECGFNSRELFGVTGSSPEPWKLYHTYNWYDTYTTIPIGEQYVFGSMWGIPPDVYRGALPGEVYVSSWFPDYTFKISFSADTGHTYRVVYHSDSLHLFDWDRKFYLFMSDRAAGVFYIIYHELVKMEEPEGHYAKICISHYSDYGETLVGTYCHDLMMHYPESCAGVLDMEAEVQGKNVALRWNQPQAAQPVAAYYVYRDDTLLAVLQQTEYLDEDLPNGNYTYHVRVMYADGCESLSYNTVKVEIDFTGIGNVTDAGGITVYPNPTKGEVFVGMPFMASLQNVEVFDLMGRTVGAINPLQKLEGCPKDGVVINISHLPTGLYFVRIQTENSVVVRKVVMSER